MNRLREKYMSKHFEFGSASLAPTIGNELREGKSIFEGALDLGKERGRQTSQPFDQTPFVDGFDLFGHDLGCKRQTGNPLGYDSRDWERDAPCSWSVGRRPQAG